MAGKNIRNKVHDCGGSQTHQLSPLRSFKDLSKNEVDRVNSALRAAANFGQPESQDEDLKNLDCLKSDQDLGSKENSSETGSRNGEWSWPFKFETAEESEGESALGSSQSEKAEKRDLFTLTINRKNRHRLETALKLLEFIEGGGNDSDSDSFLNSSEASSILVKKVSGDNKTSTPRVQALKNRTRKDY